MGTRPRTPEHFPRMKVRSDRHRLDYATTQLATAVKDLFDFVQTMQRAFADNAPKIREDLDAMVAKMRAQALTDAYGVIAGSSEILDGTSFETAGPLSIPFENGGLVDGSVMVTVDGTESELPANHPSLSGLFDHEWMWSAEERDQAEQNLVKRMTE